jgi:hypothetical protein
VLGSFHEKYGPPGWFGLILGLAACSDNTVPLTYAPTIAVIPTGPPNVAGVSVVDQRGEDDPTWLGAIRGGFGNPMKVLHTPGPLSDTVAQAFRDALKSRGLLAALGQGDVDLDVTIVKFESDQYVRREAQIRLTISLTRRSTGRQIYRDDVATDLEKGSAVSFETGAFGSVEKLRLVNQAALSQTIDEAVSRPGFLDAVRGGALPSA